MRSIDRVTDALRGRKKVVAFVGAAAALLGAGTASAATVTPAAHPAAAPARSSVTRRHSAGPARHSAVHAAVAATAEHRSSVKRAQASDRHPVARTMSWSKIEEIVGHQTSPSLPKAANELRPVAPSGPQAWMPMSGSQLANAKTIVQQALQKRMGVRSAVIAVATSMQESNLNNINYGTSDSVGLFQQRPSCGWGGVQQIMHPGYAADAFLTALREHQASDPGWVHQPLWANAQAVQGSAYPYAYAKWETQAAHLVKQIVTEVR
jgi:hypothetical protein